MKGKRAQAAMEFMAAYGWAILAVIMAITALSFMGFSVHDGPELCVLEFGISCTDYVVKENTVDLLLTNSLGKDITIIEISVDNCTQIFNTMIEPQDNQLFSINCSTSLSKGRFKAQLSVSYRDSEFTKYKNGKIVAKVE